MDEEAGIKRLLQIYRDHGQLRQNLARRHILLIPRIIFTPQEKLIYDELEKYCEGLALSRLAEANMIVGTQQISLLPIDPEDSRPSLPGKDRFSGPSFVKLILYATIERRFW